MKTGRQVAVSGGTGCLPAGREPTARQGPRFRPLNLGLCELPASAVQIPGQAPQRRESRRGSWRSLPAARKGFPGDRNRAKCSGSAHPGVGFVSPDAGNASLGSRNALPRLGTAAGSRRHAAPRAGLAGPDAGGASPGIGSPSPAAGTPAAGAGTGFPRAGRPFPRPGTATGSRRHADPRPGTPCRRLPAAAQLVGSRAIRGHFASNS